VRRSIRFSEHALTRIEQRGATQEEVVAAIEHGQLAVSREGRVAFQRNFPYHAWWKGKFYETKQVKPIVAEQGNDLIVVTVYVFYLGGGK